MLLNSLDIKKRLSTQPWGAPSGGKGGVTPPKKDLYSQQGQ